MVHRSYMHAFAVVVGTEKTWAADACKLCRSCTLRHVMLPFCTFCHFMVPKSAQSQFSRFSPVGLNSGDLRQDMLPASDKLWVLSHSGQAHSAEAPFLSHAQTSAPLKSWARAT